MAPDQAIGRTLEEMKTTLDSHADPDAQTTVTDFLDFTEYLPSDIVRSLTLIGKLDQSYHDASIKVDELTKTWGQLPSIAPESRPAPVRLRADISEHLNLAVSSRMYAHAEAVRMSDNVHRHYHKAKQLLEKLQHMMANYVSEDPKSPVASRSPQMTRAKLSGRGAGDGRKARRSRFPRFTVPGEVLAPHEIQYDSMTEDEEHVSSEESDSEPLPPSPKRTPAPAPRIKIMTNRTSTPKSPPPPKQPPKQPAKPAPTEVLSASAALNAVALLHPPAENPVIGSPDAPWLRLTLYELAKLRKRVKKNAAWTPSHTMLIRELKLLGRGPDEYREAKMAAEAEGEVFEPDVPVPVYGSKSGKPQLPPGALSVDEIILDLVTSDDRGKKQNRSRRANKAAAKQAAENAEKSDGAPKDRPKSSNQATAQATSQSPPAPKRKRKSEREALVEDEDTTNNSTPSLAFRPPPSKRNRTATSAPFLQDTVPSDSQSSTLTPESSSQLTPTESAYSSNTASVPYPLRVISTRSAASAAGVANKSMSITTSVPSEPSATESPVISPADRRKSASSTDLTRTGDGERRETRGDAARKAQQSARSSFGADGDQARPVTEFASRRSSRSHAASPGPLDTAASRRPGSRGNLAAQEIISLAADRPRRASANWLAPVTETAARPTSKRTKRPAPGVVSTTNSGGSSAVGKRKAAPKKKARATRKEKDQEPEMEEVDDEGNPIDPDEPRYCLCNRVSFGTMIQCDNVDGCKQEWFHLECVDLTGIPARTTQWYCPDCRKLLGLGEKGEVSVRGVRR